MKPQKFPKYITDSANKSILFQDYLSFLHLLNKRPLELTQIGNLRLKEIDAVHDVCKFDFFPRDEDGELSFPIRSEDELKYLRHLRQLASVNKFVTKRNHKLRLTKRGREFLQEKLEAQFILTAREQLFGCNWTFLFPYGGHRELVLEKVQDHADKLLGLWLDQAVNKWYSLEQMTADVARELQISPELRKGYFQDEDLLFNALEWILSSLFDYFDLFHSKIKKEDHFFFTITRIEKIKLTKTGQLILELYLQRDQLSTSGNFPKDIPIQEIDKKLGELLNTLKVGDKITADDIKNVVYHSPKSNGFNDLIEALLSLAKNQGQMQLAMETLQTVWNYCPHKSLDNLSPYQKTLELQTGNKIKASKPNYASNKTRAYELISDSLPQVISISSWGDNHWGVKLTKSFYQAEVELEKIRDQGEIYQAKSSLENLLKKEPLYLPAILDLYQIYRELEQTTQANLLMEYSYKHFQQLFPEEFTFGKDTFPWNIHSNRPFLTFLLEHAYHIRSQLGLKKSIPYLERMIELNPNDNQGVRDLLATSYLLTNQPQKVIKLSEKFCDDILPELAMGKVLALYKLGLTDEAKKHYQKNAKYLKHLRDELLATTHQPPPKFDPNCERVLVGGPEEAWLFWESQHSAWEGTKGVFDWLKKI